MINLLKRYINTFKGLSRSVWILAFVMLINRSGTMVIPFLTIYLTREMGFSLIDAGFVMSFFGAGSMLGTYIGGQLTDKYGYYPIMKYTLVLTGLMFIIMNYANGFWSMSLIVFLTSTISDAFRPANMTAVATLSKEEDRTRSITLIRLAVNAGWSIGPAIGGMMIAFVGYEFLFWADGLTNILAAIFLAFLLKKKYETIEHEEDENKQNKKIVWPRNFIWFLIVNTLAMIPFFQLFNTIPVYFRNELLLTEDIIGYLMAINGLLLVFFEMPLVYRLEKNYNVIKIILLGIILIGLSYVPLLFGGGVIVAAIYIVGISVGEIFDMPFANSYTVSVAGPKSIGRYLAMYGISFSLAFIITPILGLYVADEYGYNTLWIMMIGLSFLSVLVLYFKVLKQQY